MTVWRVLGIAIVAIAAVASLACALMGIVLIPGWRKSDTVTFFTVAWPVVFAAASFGFAVIAV